MKSARFLLSLIVTGTVLLNFGTAYATKWNVSVQNFTFSPSSLPNVNVGDTIRWVWVNGSHTTTSSSIPGGAATWDHPITTTNTSYEYPVTVAGTYNYVCTPHAGGGMVGSFTASVVNPVLTSINPNQALQGASFTATINGSNTNFTGSPAVSLTFSGNPNEIINATGVTVISPTVLHAQFTIPASASPGLWTLHVNSLVLANSFTVIEVVPAISFMSPNFAHQGDSFTGSVFGSNTTWTGTPTVYLSLTSNPIEVINGTNVTVINAAELTADFSIPANASTGNYSVHVDGLEQSNAFTVLSALVPALSGLSPDNGEQGSLMPVTITAENTTFVGNSPVVLLSLHANPGEVITATNIVVVNNTTLTADLDIPYQATPGLWDLNVDDLSLENAFTVIDVIPFLVSISPNSGMKGEMVTTLITAADSRFTLSSPVVMLSFSSNPDEMIDAASVNVLSDTQVEAVFDIPLAASPGLWDLAVDEMMLPQAFTVDLPIGIEEPVSGLVKLYPNPASSQVNILNASGSDLSVYNILGENVMSQSVTSESQTLDISHLTHGMYIVQIKKAGITNTQKLRVK
jgi:plastocyanin